MECDFLCGEWMHLVGPLILPKSTAGVPLHSCLGLELCGSSALLHSCVVVESADSLATMLPPPENCLDLVCTFLSPSVEP